MATEYEEAREARIQENKRKIMELGIVDAVAGLAPAPAANPVRQKRQKVEPGSPTRRSERPRTVVNYAEKFEIAHIPREPRDYTQLINGLTLDPEEAERLRADVEARLAGGSNAGGKKRGPVDSGKGVRVQGGKVYDSMHGVTCHWCRQKTLEDRVTCTNTNCGKGRRMPLSFCKKCLLNRHGEDADLADSSGKWVCPPCRGSCGPGCVACCNCGPCRKKANLEPTAQIVKLARDAGFGNVHDYLVHLVTGEEGEVITARKEKFWWGRWLKGDSEDSDQTHDDDAQQPHDDQEEEEEEQQQPAAAAPKRGRKPSAKAAAAAVGKAAAKPAKRGRGKAAAAAAGAGEEPAAAASPSEAAVAAAAAAAPPARRRGGARSSPADAAAGKKDDQRGKNAGKALVAGSAAAAPSAQGESCSDAEGEEELELALSQGDGRKARKMRMLQRMGLAPMQASQEC